MKLVIDIDDTICETIKNSTFFIKGGRGSGRTIENNILMAIYDGKPLEQEPCEDVISRRSVIDIIHHYKNDRDSQLSDLTDGVCNLPPVTPQQKTGHWIKTPGMNEYCDVCGHYFPLSAFAGRPFEINHCPACGIKMVEQQESEGKNDI